MKKIITAALMSLFLAGCTTMYVKDGATQQDWQREYNDCLVKANQAGYPGGDMAGNINRKKFLDMCVQGQGWRQQTKETVQAQSQQKSDLDQKRSDYKSKMSGFGEQTKVICAKPEYAPILAATPCSAKDVTFEQMADSAKINKTQKKVFLKYRTESASLTKEMREYVRSSATADSDRRWADYLDSTQSVNEAYSLDLYNGKSTWGEYNKSRKDLAEKVQAEWRKIYQAKH